MGSGLFSENILKKYPEIGKYLSVLYNKELEEYVIYTSLTEKFSVKELSEITEEKIENLINKHKEKEEFQNEILKSILANSGRA